MAGYSGKRLPDKLGLKSGQTVYTINIPDNYFQLLGKLPENINFTKKLKAETDFIHFFTKEKKELLANFAALKNQLSKNGILWISWPKKASKIDTDLNENIIREIGLTEGLVDVKVCAVDEIWSGLKFVYRIKDRKQEFDS